MRTHVLLVGSLLVGCGSGGHTSTVVTPTATRVERGPAVLPIDADANGLWWDEATQALLVADSGGHRILRWTDRGDTTVVATMPATGDPKVDALGQLVRTSDGTIYVTRFGGGTAGGLFAIAPSGAVQAITGLDPTRRRIGLALDPAHDHTLFETWIGAASTTNGATASGAIGELRLDGTRAAETPLFIGLDKPVGVLDVWDNLYFSDQRTGQVHTRALIVNVPSVAPERQVDVAGCDLLAAGADGSVFTGRDGGEVVQITANGIVTNLAGGFHQVRGVAYDARHHRLFVVDHEKGAGPAARSVHVIPVD